ncbi:hypothetical protein B0T24DRAFT_631830 [Lasiosphaeria ovina]|uniref:Uncharacterized protein n=1 Tax=Lasiosphaeria ovina TaxID=92902 RepID=A0AAE0K3A3_9PEZI|nr:hypothetical protein B0T24DRAFT_631830 [Lasiosphaeria ovina]
MSPLPLRAPRGQSTSSSSPLSAKGVLPSPSPGSRLSSPPPLPEGGVGDVAPLGAPLLAGAPPLRGGAGALAAPPGWARPPSGPARVRGSVPFRLKVHPAPGSVPLRLKDHPALGSASGLTARPSRVARAPRPAPPPRFARLDGFRPRFLASRFSPFRRPVPLRGRRSRPLSGAPTTFASGPSGASDNVHTVTPRGPGGPAVVVPAYTFASPLSAGEQA